MATFDDTGETFRGKKAENIFLLPRTLFNVIEKGLQLRQLLCVFDDSGGNGSGNVHSGAPKNKQAV